MEGITMIDITKINFDSFDKIAKILNSEVDLDPAQGLVSNVNLLGVMLAAYLTEIDKDTRDGIIENLRYLTEDPKFLAKLKTTVQ